MNIGLIAVDSTLSLVKDLNVQIISTNDRTTIQPNTLPHGKPPCEGNEHLLGKTNDCDEFYKTWK